MFSPRIVTAALALVASTAAISAAPAAVATQVPTQRTAMGGGAQTSESEVDVAVRQVQREYLDLLKAGNFRRAASLWSAATNVTPESLRVAGVSDWSFISSELIRSTATTAHVQLNFSVKVAPGSNTAYSEGRNLRFVHMVKENGAWKIQSITTTP